MFSGPMFRHERQAESRKRRPFVLRIGFAIGLVVIGLLIGLILFSAPNGENTQTRILYLGRALLIATMSFELLFFLFFVPSFVAGAIAEEREKDTFSMLLLTRLTPIEIVLTKLFARWLSTANLVVTGIPMLVAAAFLAGLERQAILAFLVLLSSSAFMGSLAILSSAQRDQVVVARGQAVGWIFGWLLGPPIMSVVPVASGSLWGDLIYEIKRLCSLIAPSSPISLATDPGWYYRSNAVSLEGRVALMIGLQAVFGVIAVCLAASRLKARETNPNWADPTRGHRPRCGDDPIFWREYEMPIRQGAGSLIVIRLRYLMIVLRTIVISLFGLLAVLIALAIPIGLLIGTIYYGLAAFQELWEHGYGQTGPFVARGHFQRLIEGATGLLAFLPALGASALVSARITTERDKKTWDAFLTTPLTGEEILRSKARVAVQGLWLAARPVPWLWLLGLVCGVLTPLGVGLAAVDLIVVVWVNVALGLYLAIKPGTTTSTSNRITFGSMAIFACHAPVLYAALISPREFAVFATWDGRLRWLLILAELAIPTLTAALAWFLTRQTLDRFNEWVGRPIAGGKVSPVDVAARM